MTAACLLATRTPFILSVTGVLGGGPIRRVLANRWHLSDSRSIRAVQTPAPGIASGDRSSEAFQIRPVTSMMLTSTAQSPFQVTTWAVAVLAVQTSHCEIYCTTRLLGGFATTAVPPMVIGYPDDVLLLLSVT